MKQIEIKLHSFIDIITNSSTEIYVSVNEYSVNMIKDLINNLLKFAKSDKTCDDLFVISINNWRCSEWINDQICSYYSDNKLMSWSELRKYSNEELHKLYFDETGETEDSMKTKYYEAIEEEYDRFDESSIYVRAKTDDKEIIEVTEILNKLRNLFCINVSPAN